MYINSQNHAVFYNNEHVDSVDSVEGDDVSPNIHAIMPARDLSLRAPTLGRCSCRLA